MARSADEGNKKRARPIGSEGSVKSIKEDGKTLQDVLPIAMQDKSSQFRGKESPLAKKVRTDEQNLSQTLEIKEAQQAKVASGPDPSASKSMPKSSPDLENLRAFVEVQGGTLGDGWHVDTYRSNGVGKLVKTFVSPSKEKFRSRVEVARHLGLSTILPKKGEPHANNVLALPQMDYDKNEHHIAAMDGHLTFSSPKTKDVKSKHRNFGLADLSGQRKEHSSTMQDPRDETVANEKNGISIACNSPKGNVSGQKAPAVSVVTERCQVALRSIISTENFAALSNILNRGSPSGSLESPIKINALPGSIDLQLIHLRLSNGVYGLDPELFSADIKQVWRNISAFGNELVALAQSLLEFSEKLYKQQIMSLFEVSGLKDASKEKERELSGSQHGDLFNGHDLISLNPPEKAKVLQINESNSVHDKRRPTQTYKSKRMAKLGNKLKQSLVFKAEVTDKDVPGICKGCGLEQGNDFLTCKLCKAVFHVTCTVSLSSESQEGEWCCPSCADNEKKCTHALANTLEIPVQLDKTTGKAGLCEACKKEDDDVLRCDECEAAYHMKCIVPAIEKVPDESWFCSKCTEGQKSSVKDVHEIVSVTDDHNCSVCDRIPKAASLDNAEIDVERQCPEHPSFTSGTRHGGSVKQVAPQDVDRAGSALPIVEEDPPEPRFLLANENACKACGIESAKSMILCSFCTNRYHLSCLKPALKRAPRSTWYCPSCLCRVCKVDADDDKILLCDTCDEGYHTYCLNPALNEKPKGAWFCPMCIKPEEVPNPPSPKLTEVSKRKRKSTEPRRST